VLLILERRPEGRIARISQGCAGEGATAARKEVRSHGKRRRPRLTRFSNLGRRAIPRKAARELTKGEARTKGSHASYGIAKEQAR
jgi:hypothetical protein